MLLKTSEFSSKSYFAHVVEASENKQKKNYKTEISQNRMKPNEEKIGNCSTACDL